MSRLFLGTSDPVNVAAGYPSSVIWEPANSSFSYSAWIFPTTWGADTGNGPGYIICDDQSHFAMGLYVSKSSTGGGGTLTGFTATKTHSLAVSADSSLVLNQWQHVAYVFNSSSFVSRLFVNGVEVAYAAQTTGVTLQTSSGSLQVGTLAVVSPSSDFGFTGYIDSIGFWNTTLTQAQVVQAMAFQGTGSTAVANLLGYWPFLGITSGNPAIEANSVSGGTNMGVIVAVGGPNSPGQVQGNTYDSTKPFIGSMSETSDDSLGTQYIGHIIVISGSAPAGLPNPYLGKIKVVGSAPDGASDPLLGQVVIVSDSPAGGDPYLGHVKET